MKLSEYLDTLRGKSVAVIGIGVSNTPLIKMLLEAGLSVTARDRRTIEQFGGQPAELSKPGAKLRVGADYLSDLNEDVIFRTPGLHPDTPELKAAKANGSIITSEMEAFFQVCPCPIIAVSGSDGKTTTTSLIAELLSEAGHTIHLGGNIGSPLLADVPVIQPTDYAVVELSSFQLMTMETSPHIAVLTNITPNHLDYHGVMAEYIAAKTNIFMHQGSRDLLVLNADNELTKGFTGLAKGKVRHFSRRARPENGFYFDGNLIFFIEDSEETIVMPGSMVCLRGVHNIENLMAAFSAVVDLVGLDVCRRVAERFAGVEHRNEPVREVNGVKYFNDSIASSPTRTIAGLRSFDQKVILIAGGYDKKIPYDELGPVIKETVKILVLTGATAPKIKAAVESACANDECPIIIEEPDFEKAVLTAAAMSLAGDIVTLSPASASFDRFKDFAERGNFFKTLVSKL